MTKLYRKHEGNYSQRARVWFVVLDGLVYPTIEHPEGQSPLPWFRIRGEEMFPHTGHPCGPGFLPWYRRKGNELVALKAHPRREQENAILLRIEGEWPIVIGSNFRTPSSKRACEHTPSKPRRATSTSNAAALVADRDFLSQ